MRLSNGIKAATVFIMAMGTAIVTLAQPAPKIDIASLPKLLIPVDQNEITDILNNNDLFIRQHLITAKRHRIVKINTDVLFGEDVFTITPFDDVPHVVKKEDLSLTSYRGLQKWRGKFLSPAPDFDLEARVRAIQHEKPATTAILRKAVRDKFEKFELTIRQKMHVIQPDQQTDPGVSSIGIRRAGSATEPAKMKRITTIHTVFTSPLHGIRDNNGNRVSMAAYRIYSLPKDPEYHLVYEPDFDKINRTAPGHPERARRYNRLLDEIDQERERRKETIQQ